MDLKQFHQKKFPRGTVEEAKTSTLFTQWTTVDIPSEKLLNEGGDISEEEEQQELNSRNLPNH